jgi:hypothetical protein
VASDKSAAAGNQQGVHLFLFTAEIQRGKAATKGEKDIFTTKVTKSLAAAEPQPNRRRYLTTKIAKRTKL